MTEKYCPAGKIECENYQKEPEKCLVHPVPISRMASCLCLYKQRRVEKRLDQYCPAIKQQCYHMDHMSIAGVEFYLCYANKVWVDVDGLEVCGWPSKQKPIIPTPFEKPEWSKEDLEKLLALAQNQINQRNAKQKEKESCETCRFSVLDKHNPSYVDIECHRHCPDNSKKLAGWPSVDGMDWCGDYERKAE